MAQFADFSELFLVDPEAPRMMGYVINPAIAPVPKANAVAASFELLRFREGELTEASGKQLFLQISPTDALKLAATILAVAEDRQWEVPSDLIDKVERIRVQPKGTVN